MRALLFCLWFLCPGFINAQDGSKVICRFLCFGSAEPPPPLINISEKGDEIACTIPVDTISPEIGCFAQGNSISFLSAADHKPAAVAKVSAGLKAAILVFLPNVTAAGAATPPALPWRVLVIADSPKDFPDGGVLVANFYSNDIRFIIGEHRNLLRSRGTQGLKRPEQRDAFNMAPAVFQFQQGDTWRTASESMLRFIPGMRYLIFAYVDPASGRPRVETYQDIRPAINPPAK